MTKPVVIGGWYTKVEYLTKMSVARVTVELPLDLWEQNHEVLGVPPSLDGAKKFVAVTRITEEAFKKWYHQASPQENGPDTVVTPGATPSVAVEGQDRPQRSYTRSQIAALKLKDPEFQSWLQFNTTSEAERGQYITDEGFADALLKDHLGITSKRELDTLPHKGEAFDRLLATYDNRAFVR